MKVVPDGCSGASAGGACDRFGRETTHLGGPRRRLEWQARPLEKLYLVVSLNPIVLKIRDKGSVRNKHAYSLLGSGSTG